MSDARDRYRWSVSARDIYAPPAERRIETAMEFLLAAAIGASLAWVLVEWWSS